MLVRSYTRSCDHADRWSHSLLEPETVFECSLIASVLCELRAMSLRAADKARSGTPSRVLDLGAMSMRTADMARAADLTAASRPSRPTSVPSPTPAFTKGGSPAAATATAAPSKAPAKAAPGTLVFDATFESGNLVRSLHMSLLRAIVVVTYVPHAEDPMHWYHPPSPPSRAPCSS